MYHESNNFFFSLASCIVTDKNKIEIVSTGSTGLQSYAFSQEQIIIQSVREKISQDGDK